MKAMTPTLRLRPVHVVLALLGIAVATLPRCRAESYAEWIASFGLSGDAAAMTADPDGDGRPNLMEYALADLSPVVPNPSQTEIFLQYLLPDNTWSALGDGRVNGGAPPAGAKLYTVLRYKRRAAAQGLRYVPQSSSDLNIWAWGASAIEEWTDEQGYIYARATFSGDVFRKHFMRLKVSTLD